MLENLKVEVFDGCNRFFFFFFCVTITMKYFDAFAGYDGNKNYIIL